MKGMNPGALDRYITGNYGEDQFAGEWPEPTALERQQEREAELYEVERDLRERIEATEQYSDAYYGLHVQLRSVVRRLRGMGDA